VAKAVTSSIAQASLSIATNRPAEGPHVAYAAFPPAVVVLLEGADSAVRERHAVQAERGQSRRRPRAQRTIEIVADRKISGAARRYAGSNHSRNQYHYLDNQYPGRTRFIPADAKAALQTRLRDRFYDLYVHLPMQKVVGDRLRPPGNWDPFGVDEAKARIQSCYGMIDKEMADKHWAMGEAFTLADCAAAPALFYGNKVVPIGNNQKNVTAYFERLKARPSFARVLREAEPYFAMFPQET
jgi:hypothetical protein